MNNLFNIKEAVNNYILGCDAKVNTSLDKLMIKAFFAGMMIALGASGSSVAAHTLENVALARVIAATVFPVGLMMVVLTGAELFTGDCLMIMATASKKHKINQLLKVLCTVYVGNFIGGACVALFVVLSGQLDYSGGLLGAYTIKVALSKVSMSFTKAIVSGVLCNILVCLAVIMVGCAKDVTGKLLASFFVIFLFVTEGFEHCVANMYYIVSGLIAMLNSNYVQTALNVYGCTIEQLSNLNIQSFVFANLLPVTIGNIIGGMLFIGLPLWYLNYEQSK